MAVIETIPCKVWFRGELWPFATLTHPADHTNRLPSFFWIKVS